MRILLCVVLLMMAGSGFAAGQTADQPPMMSTVDSMVNDSPGLQASDVPNKEPNMVLAYQFVRGDGLIVSNVCNTPMGSCFMTTYWPIVGTCWCPSAGGPVAGTPGG